MKSIVFLGNFGFFERDFNRFHIQRLNKIYKIYFLDFTKISNKEFFKKERKKYFYSKELILIDSVKKFKKFFNEKKIECVFDLSNSNKLDVFRRIINQNKIKLIKYQTSLVPNFKRDFFSKIRYFFFVILLNKKLIIYYIKKLIKCFTLEKFRKIKFYYDYIFCVGYKGENSKTKLIFSHSSDYDALLNKREKNKINEKYLVFIDQYLPFHNGYIHRGIPPFVTPSNYYNSVNRFLDLLKKKLRYDIIIALHPRSNYEKNYFQNKKTINYKKTNEYISKSSGIINYTSTTMCYAVMYKKPIIFYTTKEINSSHDAFHVNYLSNVLGSKLINIDEKNIDRQFSKKNLFKVDHLKYQKFFNNYICHIKSEQKPNYKKIIEIVDNRKKF
tara:strand:+ start:500 stop:1657 length:1158 start_codon:yes stop_codon:yes gene_type:complete